MKKASFVFVLLSQISIVYAGASNPEDFETYVPTADWLEEAIWY